MIALAKVDLPSDASVADRAFARAAGSLPIDGNAVRLLQDAAENYPAWLAAIQEAEHLILFENYIVDDDVVGREFAEALAAKGVEIVVPVSEAPDGGLTMDFLDPDRNALSLYQPAGAPRRR